MAFNCGVSIVGTGNVAWHLANKFNNAGIKINIIIGRNLVKAEELATIVNTSFSDNLLEIPQDTELVLLCLSDASISQFAEQVIKKKLPVAHTAASIPLSVFGNYRQGGVFYPFQTFTKGIRECEIEFPVGIEANSKEMYTKLKLLAGKITDNVFQIDSEKRKILHVSGIFANNFVNFLFVNAFKLLEENEIDIALLMPLINETVNKLKEGHPTDLQTGPAVRGSNKILNEHLKLLQYNNNLYELYKFMSNNIQTFYKINDE